MRPHRESGRNPPGRRSIGLLALLAVFAAAPTVGDIGSCGAAAEPLDAAKFFDARLSDECALCSKCGFRTPACARACDPRTPRPKSFPTGCQPAVHDGEVCLRKLESLGCDAASRLVGDAAVVPTECDFCPAPPGVAR